MAVRLPYRFDTSDTPKVILRGVLGLLLLVIAPGIIYSLLTNNPAAALQLLLIGGLTLYFGYRFLGGLEASRGTVTADAVVVEPGTLYGIRLSGPAGRFQVQQFKAVRVQCITAPFMAQGRPHERVLLAGRDGTPDILIARTALGVGQSLGGDLAAALGLTYEEESAPY
jgi:hypothetical protein